MKLTMGRVILFSIVMLFILYAELEYRHVKLEKKVTIEQKSHLKIINAALLVIPHTEDYAFILGALMWERDRIKYPIRTKKLRALMKEIDKNEANVPELEQEFLTLLKHRRWR